MTTAIDTAARAAVVLAAEAVIDQVRTPASPTLYRATLHGTGGAAAIGYGDTEAQARADLAATVEFNLEHNDRPIA